MKKLLFLICVFPAFVLGQSIVVTNGVSYIEFASPLTTSNLMENAFIESIESPNPADTNAVYTIKISKDFQKSQQLPDGSQFDSRSSVSASLKVSIQERIAFINQAVPGINITEADYDQKMTVEYIRTSVLGIAVQKFNDLFNLAE